jgi:hypothetical protein
MQKNNPARDSRQLRLRTTPPDPQQQIQIEVEKSLKLRIGDSLPEGTRAHLLRTE